MRGFSYLGRDPIYAKTKKRDALVPFRSACAGFVGKPQLELPQRKKCKSGGRTPPHHKGNATNNRQQKHEHYEHVPEQPLQKYWMSIANNR